MSESRLDEIIDKIKCHPNLVAADDFEITVQRTESATTSFADGSSKIQRFGDDFWMRLRVIYRKQPGVAVSYCRSESSIDELVQSALSSARNSSVDPWFRFPILKEANWSPPESGNEISVVEKSLFERANEGVLRCEEEYKNTQTTTKLARKWEDKPLLQKQQSYRLSLCLLGRAFDEPYWVSDQITQNCPLSDKERRFDELVYQLGSYRKAVCNGQIPDKCNAVLGPKVLNQILPQIVPWFYADKVFSGQSQLTEEHLAGKQQIFSDKLTLFDDGQYPMGANSLSFDMEGSRTQKTCVVRKGKLESLLYDNYYATRENRVSTGNLSRSHLSWDTEVQASQFYVEPGDSPPTGLLATMGDGFVLEELQALELNADLVLSVKAMGWRVNSGKCVEPLLGIKASIHVFDLFGCVQSVGNDLRFSDWIGAPSILFSKIPLRGSPWN